MLIKENTSAVVSDLIDGEMMLLNMDAGNYYSLQGSAKALWSSIKLGTSSTALLAALETRYPEASPAQLRQELDAFLATLAAESLVVPCLEAAPAALEFDGPYEPPRVERYTDLQDLLLIDPIHEADDAGWPAVPA